MSKTQWTAIVAVLVGIAGEIGSAFHLYALTGQQQGALNHAGVGLFAIGAIVVGAVSHERAAHAKAAGVAIAAHIANPPPATPPASADHALVTTTIATENATAFANRVAWTPGLTASPSVAADSLSDIASITLPGETVDPAAAPVTHPEGSHA